MNNIEILKNTDNDVNFDKNDEISSQNSDNDGIFNKKIITDETRNFKYLDELIHSRGSEGIPDSDIILNYSKSLEYMEGIKLDVDDLIIDGNGHTIDAREKTSIFYCTGKIICIKQNIIKIRISYPYFYYTYRIPDEK